MNELADEVHPLVLDGLVKNQMIWNPASTTTMKGLWTIYLSGQIKPQACSKQEFGVNGDHTDLVCDMREKAIKICKEEPLCTQNRLKKTPTYALKGAVLADVPVVASALCDATEQYPVNVPNCMVKAATQIQGLITAMPDQFDNQLLSLGSINPQQYSTYDRIFGYGDAYLDIRAEMYGQDQFPIFMAVRTIQALAIYIIDTNLELSGGLGSVGNDFILDDKQRFLVKSLEGYLIQKYSSSLFDSKDLLPDGAVTEFLETAETDSSFYKGAYYAWKCFSLEDFLLNAEKSFTTHGSKDSQLMVSTGEFSLKYMMGDRCTNACIDEEGLFTVSEGGSDKGFRTCDWVVRNGNPNNNGVPRRCTAYPEVADNCPDTCKSCIRDSDIKFTIKDIPKKKNCDWVAGKKTKARCHLPGVAKQCQKTCKDYVAL